ncbi:MAG: hypothetical protein GYB20_11450 [Oceanospirillales bacterium]|nr:hypothetical protein [Oceanospirillales bacterium]
MKQTGKVKLLPGALVPNQRGLWYTHLEKLNEAILGIEQMKSAEDRISYESGWVCRNILRKCPGQNTNE